MILHNIEDQGVGVGSYNINLRYVDDTVLLVCDEDKLQQILTTVTEESKKNRLQLNAKKTNSMIISKKAVLQKCNIKRKRETIWWVDTFKYLGCSTTTDGKSVVEIKKISMVKSLFNSMKCIFINRNKTEHKNLEVSSSLRLQMWQTNNYLIDMIYNSKSIMFRNKDKLRSHA